MQALQALRKLMHISNRIVKSQLPVYQAADVCNHVCTCKIIARDNGVGISAHNLPCLPIHKRKIRKIPFFFTTIHILFLYVNIGFLISYLLHIFSLPLEFFYVFSSFENSKLNFIELLLFVLLLSFSFIDILIQILEDQIFTILVFNIINNNISLRII